jgi:hypothetical protein
MTGLVGMTGLTGVFLVKIRCRTTWGAVAGVGRV